MLNFGGVFFLIFFQICFGIWRRNDTKKNDTKIRPRCSRMHDLGVGVTIILDSRPVKCGMHAVGCAWRCFAFTRARACKCQSSPRALVGKARDLGSEGPGFEPGSGHIHICRDTGEANIPTSGKRPGWAGYVTNRSQAGRSTPYQLPYAAAACWPFWRERSQRERFGRDAQI